MISTSSHNDWQSDKYRTYSISGNRGKDANYQGKCYPELAPKLSFWKVWHNNIGKISEEENNRYYVQEEPNTEFCHRHIVAAWFEILLGVKVPELKAKDYQIEETDRPEYIKEYLEDAMRLNRNMRGFKSLRALYLFEKGENLEAKADELEEKTGKCYDGYRQTACFLRCDANMAEDEYRELQNQKKLIKTQNK